MSERLQKPAIKVSLWMPLDLYDRSMLVANAGGSTFSDLVRELLRAAIREKDRIDQEISQV